MELKKRDPYYIMIDAIDKHLITADNMILVIKEDNGEIVSYSPWEIEVTEAIGLLTAAAIKTGVNNGLV